MIRSVVLDVGETLIDESRIWWRWAIRIGVTPMTLMGALGAMAATNGSYRAAFELVRPGFDISAELAAWEKDDPDGLRENFDADDLYPDVRSSLAAMREAGYQVVIAGNQPIQAYDQLLAMDLPHDGIYTERGLGRLPSPIRRSSPRSWPSPDTPPTRSSTSATGSTTTCLPARAAGHEDGPAAAGTVGLPPRPPRRRRQGRHDRRQPHRAGERLAELAR